MQLEDLLNEGGRDGESPKKETPLKSLEADLKFYNESIKEVANEIIAEGISPHPIFVAHQHEVKLGELILDRKDLNTDWSIQASTLEEFIEKGIIHRDKKDRFVKHYKDPHEHMCLFVIVPEGANFVFLSL